jgi:hypothetical protein
MARRTTATLVAFVLCAAIALGACSGDDDESTSPTTSALCKNVDALKSSVQELKNVDIVQNGVSSLRSALDDVQSDATALADAAKDDFKPQVDALQQALSTFGTAVRNVRDNGLTPVQDAAQAVQTAATNLEDAITSKQCS